MQQDVDVAIVGAGAAGIAAARRLIDRGRTVLLVEALDRVGGRAHTVLLDGHACDLGCGWLHSATRNPLVAVAEAEGLPVHRAEPAWRRQLRNLGFPEADQHAAQATYAALLQRLHQRPSSDCVGDLVAPDEPWRPFLEAMSGYYNGAPLAELSVTDFLAYDDSATDHNWRLPGGYGTLFAHLANTLPATLGTTVSAIDHGGTHVLVETNHGTVRAAAAIVTVSTGVLARGGIAFRPAIDDHLHAATGLPLGLADKLFLRLPDDHSLPAESHLTGDPHAAGTGSYYICPFGRPLIEAFFGGAGARALEAQGEAAALAFAREELGALLGRTLADRLEPLRWTEWGQDAAFGGSYSHALPGRAADRAVLATPPSDRLHFAGEACSATDFSTAHGAWATGLAAADRIAAMLG